MKIVNRKKFIKTISIIFISIFLITTIFINKSYSIEKDKYKTIIISKGETLWDIAKTEVEHNKYFNNNDIRNVIFEIKKVNNMESSNVSEGMKIKIPIY